MKFHAIALTLAIIPIFVAELRGQDIPLETIENSKQSFDQSHAAFTEILKENIRGKKVDYASLKKNPAALNAYLDSLAAVAESTFATWTREQRMAYLINLYNAATLKLVVDHYPVDSIKDIGGFFSSPWKQSVVRLFGKRETLDHIEHDLLRPKFRDPRVHFAVNCASIGCPSLRAEAYQATKLDAQLDDQGRIFLQDASKNYLDSKNKTLHLSPIFKWFKEDFIGKSGSVEKFVAPYFNDVNRKVILGGGLSINYTDYNWKLNDR